MVKKRPEDVAEPTETERLPYEAPAIAWEESIESKERLMSACQKVEGAGEPCDSAGGAS
jgi:hypothetical protein